jgi:vancomycin resistance protein VanJ
MASELPEVAATSSPHRSAPRRRSLPVRAFLWVITAYGLAATVALVAIAVIGDRTAWTYLAALVSFWWLLPAPVLLLMVVVLRSPWAVAATLVPALVCGYLQGPYVLHALDGGGGDQVADFRVATFNLSNGRPVDSLTTLVDADRPDILLLQEVTSNGDQLAALAPGYPYASIGPGTNGIGHDGYAILSRFPITADRPVTGLPPEARAADLVTVDVDGRAVTVLSVHLASPCIGCPANTTYPGGGTTSSARMRVAEAKRYAEVIRDLLRRGEAVIVGGDLNASPLNRPLHEFTAAGLTDAQREVGTSPGLTRGPGPGLARVDVVLVGGLTPVRVVEGPRGHSTHSPVVADLAWPPSSGG